MVPPEFLYLPSVVEKSSLNPFTPGTGRLPPYLAGREPEQRVLRGLFERLHVGSPINRPLIVYGPRGNGKTALLRWTREQVEAEERLEWIWLTPAEIPSRDELASQLQVDSWMRRLAPANLSVAGVGVGFRESDRPQRLAMALEARAKARPFVLFLDEAHTIGAEVGRLLLNAARTAGGSAPFLLILAGTPDLEDRLSGIGASFWNRADIRPLGRLDSRAAAEAIRRPLDSDGVEIEPAALDRIVRDSHGYPYFLQVWGEAVWERKVPSADGRRRVTTAVVEEATQEFEATRDRYYRTRFNELDAADLLPAAREVALALRGKEQLPHGGLREAVRRATGNGGPDEQAAARALRHLGLVWQSDGAPVWEPGIPSLLDYILEYAPAPTA